MKFLHFAEEVDLAPPCVNDNRLGQLQHGHSHHSLTEACSSALSRQLRTRVPVMQFFANVYRTRQTIGSQGGPSTLAHFPLSCAGTPHGQRWPKAKNDGIAMSSESPSSGNTGPQALLWRSEPPHSSRVPPHPMPSHAGKPLRSPAWPLVDPPTRPPPSSPTLLESI